MQEFRKENGGEEVILSDSPRVEIIPGDNMDYMKNYNDKHFNLAIVDPPYGLGEKLTQGGTWAAKYSKQDSEWDVAPTLEYWDELFRISQNQIVWGGNYFPLPATRGFIIWDKVAHIETMADCEFAWTSFDTNAKIFCHPRNTNEPRIHLCQKPIKLYEWQLKKFAKQGDKILDTHLGSGSSAIACYKMGFDFVGIEKDATSYGKAIKRINNIIDQFKLAI